jgi:hypothetical protein
MDYEAAGRTAECHVSACIFLVSRQVAARLARFSSRASNPLSDEIV